MNKYHIADEKDIEQLLTTDIYFKRTVAILEKEGASRRVYAEFTSSPSAYPYGVFAGLEYVLRMVEGLPVDLYAIPEGTVFKFRDGKGVRVPVMAIEGDYRVFSEYETPLLGFICHASGIATKSFLIKNAAGDKVVLSFGIRRVHPALAPFVDRNAYIGGCDGVSSIIGAETIGREPQGTMPHALMIVMGEEEAWLAYHRALPPEVKRIILVDTFSDEKEAALRAVKLIGKDVYGVRLDTPGSRRGSMEEIVKELRWELDIRGYRDVKILVSGGLDVDSVKSLNMAGADGFGVGTSISNARVVDFAMDIVEVEGKPVAKKGKFSGRKLVYRCKNCGEIRVETEEGDYRCTCGGEMEMIFHKFVENGKVIRKISDVEEIKRYVESQRRIWREKDM